MKILFDVPVDEKLDRSEFGKDEYYALMTADKYYSAAGIDKGLKKTVNGLTLISKEYWCTFCQEEGYVVLVKVEDGDLTMELRHHLC
jgi:hypothetical protein